MAIVFLILTAAFADVFAGRNFYSRDLTRYYFPAKKIVHELVRSGEFPSWNPYYSAGQPLAANPEYEVFYPPQWLIFLPDYYLGFRLHIIVHFYLAALGMFLLIRSLGARPLACAFGALTFAGGGLFLSNVDLLPILFAVTWTPYIVLFARLTVKEFSWRHAALTALFGGLQALVGEPTTIVQTWLIVAGAGVLLATRVIGISKMRALARAAVLVVLLGVWAALIGAVQLLPAADHAADSIRSKPFSFAFVERWSMPPLRPLELFVPDLFGSLAGNGDLYWGGALYPGSGYPFFVRIYSGFLLPVLLITGALRRHRYFLPAAIGIGSAYLLAIGSHTPLLRLLHESGIFANIRFPEKFILTAIFCAIVFAAVVLDEVLAERSAARIAAAVAAAVAIAIFAMLSFALTPSYSEVFATLWQIAEPRLVTASRASWILAALSAAAFAAALWLMTKGSARRVAVVVLSLLVVIDLTVRMQEIAPRTDREFFTVPPMPRELQTLAAHGRLFHQADWFRESAVADRYLAPGQLRYWVFRNGLYPMTPAAWGIPIALERDYDQTLLLPTRALTDAMWDVRAAGRRDWAEPFMAMSNVWYRAMYRPFEEAVAASKGDVRHLIPIHVIATERVPRFYFADEVVQASNGRELAAAMQRKKLSSRVAVGSFGPKPGEGRVLRVDERPNRIVLDVVAESEALLVASVTRHKYWRVEVDGEEVAALPANFAFQAVRLKRGPHRVELEYRNPLITGGAMLSALFLLAAVVALFAGRRPLRPSSSESR